VEWGLLRAVSGVDVGLTPGAHRLENGWMRIELKVSPDLPSQVMPYRVYDPNDDDVRAILMEACHELDGWADFLISGLGQERWPVDVGTDLSVFLEQLPDALRAIAARKSAEIYLYEQGVDRLLALEPTGAGYAVHCRSGTDWRPWPAVEEVDSLKLEGMLVAVRDEFLEALERMAPELRLHPWIVEWQEACGTGA
jgi:hypothetical protein